MQPVISINGKLVSRKQATLSVFDNSLLYAEGLFESVLAVEDRLIFGQGHLARLQDGAKAIGLRVPVGAKQLYNWMVTAVKKHPAPVKKVRLTISAGESAAWSGRAGKPQIIIIVTEHELPTKPFRLLVSSLRVDQLSSLRQVKTLSYVLQSIALKEARAKEYDDSLLLNQKSQVAEITSANIWWVKSGVIMTPPLGAGCLPGVTRAVLIREIGRLGLKLAEKETTLDAMLKADELFLTSSLKLVLPIGEVSDGALHRRFEIGPITERLAKHLRGLAGLS